ncbi:MAG: HD domain-containing protein [Candidatus Nealsonbacteria bacterium]|nr:HD domain-containing protein [Candidatus Nealsonbacteria bacterium]
MKNIFNFLLEIGKLKDVRRKGITFYGVKKPDSATDHSFRMAWMIWLLGRDGKINMEKALKVALVHDICKIITGDITPYDGFLPKDRKERNKLVKRWRRLSIKKKEEIYINKFKKEYKALRKMTSKLPKDLKREIINLWLSYHQMKSSEARLVHQIDVTENLLEAFECWKKDKKFPTQPWWEHIDEVIDNPNLLKLSKEIEKEELKKTRKKRKN